MKKSILLLVMVSCMAQTLVYGMEEEQNKDLVLAKGAFQKGLAAQLSIADHTSTAMKEEKQGNPSVYYKKLHGDLIKYNDFAKNTMTDKCNASALATLRNDYIKNAQINEAQIKDAEAVLNQEYDKSMCSIGGDLTDSFDRQRAELAFLHKCQGLAKNGRRNSVIGSLFFGLGSFFSFYKSSLINNFAFSTLLPKLGIQQLNVDPSKILGIGAGLFALGFGYKFVGNALLYAKANKVKQADDKKIHDFANETNIDYPNSINWNFNAKANQMSSAHKGSFGEVMNGIDKLIEEIHLKRKAFDFNLKK